MSIHVHPCPSMSIHVHPCPQPSAAILAQVKVGPKAQIGVNLFTKEHCFQRMPPRRDLEKAAAEKAAKAAETMCLFCCPLCDTHSEHVAVGDSVTLTCSTPGCGGALLEVEHYRAAAGHTSTGHTSTESPSGETKEVSIRRRRWGKKQASTPPPPELVNSSSSSSIEPHTATAASVGVCLPTGRADQGSAQSADRAYFLTRSVNIDHLCC